MLERRRSRHEADRQCRTSGGRVVVLYGYILGGRCRFLFCQKHERYQINSSLVNSAFVGESKVDYVGRVLSSFLCGLSVERLQQIEERAILISSGRPLGPLRLRVWTKE